MTDFQTLTVRAAKDYYEYIDAQYERAVELAECLHRARWISQLKKNNRRNKRMRRHQR
jgi:hypothetical protein